MGTKKPKKKTDERTRKMIAAGKAAARGQQASLKDYASAVDRRKAGKVKAKATRAANAASRQAVKARIRDGKKMLSNGNDFPITKATPGDVRTIRDQLAAGDPVFVTWPGTADGTNRRRGVLHGYTKGGDPMVLVAHVNARGEYTGELAKKPRTFQVYEVFSVATEANTPRAEHERIRPNESAAQYELRRRGVEQLAAAGYCAEPFKSARRDDEPCTLSRGHQGKHENTSVGLAELPTEQEIAKAKLGLANADAVSGAGTLAMDASAVVMEVDAGVEIVRDFETAISATPTPLACDGEHLPPSCGGRCYLDATPPAAEDAAKPPKPPRKKRTAKEALEAASPPWERDGAVVMAPPPADLPNAITVIMPGTTDAWLADKITDAEHLARMGNLKAPPANADEAKARLDAVDKAAEKALVKARAADRTEARAAQIADTTLSCAKCGSAMLTTRSGIQRVCARCDYYERKDIATGAWVGHDEDGVYADETVVVAAPVSAPDDMLPMLPDDETLPADEGKMPWE